MGNRRSQAVALNSSSLSWAKVAASVTFPPNALFLVVVTMRPASANKETDRMTRVISTSNNVKPFDWVDGFKVSLQNDLPLEIAKPVPRSLEGISVGKEWRNSL